MSIPHEHTQFQLIAPNFLFKEFLNFLESFFYNESFATSEAGSEFDNQMVSIYLGDQTVEEGFQKVQKFFEEEVWSN